MATILAHIKIKPGSEARFESVVRKLYAQSHAGEQALRRYEYWRGQEPGTYYCLLAFDDFLGFMAHQASPHHETAAPLLIDALADMKLEWVDPIQDASPLPASVPQQVPDTASDLVKRYAEMFPVAEAAWWSALRSASSGTGSLS